MPWTDEFPREMRRDQPDEADRPRVGDRDRCKESADREQGHAQSPESHAGRDSLVVRKRGDIQCVRVEPQRAEPRRREDREGPKRALRGQLGQPPRHPCEQIAAQSVGNQLLEQHRASAEDRADDDAGKDERGRIMRLARAPEPRHQGKCRQSADDRTRDFAAEGDGRNRERPRKGEYERDAESSTARDPEHEWRRERIAKQDLEREP